MHTHMLHVSTPMPRPHTHIHECAGHMQMEETQQRRLVSVSVGMAEEQIHRRMSEDKMAAQYKVPNRGAFLRMIHTVILDKVLSCIMSG